MKVVPITISGIKLGDLRVYDTDTFACPVCGHKARSDVPPVLVVDGSLDFSWDICPQCETQFGLDDFEMRPHGLTDLWSRLRQEWQNRCRAIS